MSTPSTFLLSVFLLCLPAWGQPQDVAASCRIALTSSTVEIHFLEFRGNTLRISELAPYEVYAPDHPGLVLWEGIVSNQPVTIPRYDGARDRLYSQFAVVDPSTGKQICAPQWVTDLSSLETRKFEIPWPESKKGLTCIVDVQDAITLGCRYLSEGVLLPSLIDWKNPNPEVTWVVDGEKIPINMNYVHTLDQKYKTLTAAGVNITPILVNAIPTVPEPGNPLIHPWSDLAKAPFHLGAFNLTDERGVRCYRAALEFLADRYTQPDQRYGLISGIVIGNELQAHYAWHNMGDCPAEKVIPHYVLALRLADLAVRQFHRDLRVYASFEHHWTLGGHLNDSLKEIPGKTFIDQIQETCVREGNFPWCLAFHPYAEDLFEPRFWKDRSAVLHYETPRITFKNLEVLPVYMHQSKFFCEGKPRRIILSEQGFHTPKEADGEKVQAAAYAYAYYKIQHLDGISAFMLHRHVSARDEGGLDLGLWTYDPDEPSGFQPKNKKFIWDVFRQADTSEWEKVFEFAKPIIGIKDWKEALPSQDIITTPLPATPGEIIVYDLYKNLNKAEGTNQVPSGWRTEVMIVAGGWPTPSILHHPPQSGKGEATYQIQLPILEPGKQLLLQFYTGFTAQSENGVGFEILVDGQKVWQTEQKATVPIAHKVDLSAWAGKSIALTLSVDALGNPSYDWANWVQPQIVMEDKSK